MFFIYFLVRVRVIVIFQVRVTFQVKVWALLKPKSENFQGSSLLVIIIIILGHNHNFL
jgi:hypothetical protein